MFVAIAIHHVTPEHTDDMLAFMRRVIERTAGSPGLIDFEACRDVVSGALAGYSRWDSQAAFEAGLEAITSLRDEREPKWTSKPDELITLEVL